MISSIDRTQGFTQVRGPHEVKPLLLPVCIMDWRDYKGYLGERVLAEVAMVYECMSQAPAPPSLYIGGWVSGSPARLQSNKP